MAGTGDLFSAGVQAVLSAILFILAIVLAVKGAKTIFGKKDKPQAALKTDTLRALSLNPSRRSNPSRNLDPSWNINPNRNTKRLRPGVAFSFYNKNTTWVLQSRWQNITQEKLKENQGGERETLWHTKTILAEEREGVLLITFNRPKARNAMSSLMMEEFSSELERWDNDPNQRCCIITNAGTCFCAGADLKELAAGTYHLPKGKENWGLLGMSKHRFKKPLIAAVNGVCVGGGLGLVLACDIAIASNHSVFGLPEARHGRASTGDGAILRLMQQIPQK